MSNKKWEGKYDEFVSNLEIKDRIMFVGYDQTKQFISQLLQETEDRVRREVIEEVNKYICNYKEKYRGCGMADSMLALDDLIQSLKGGSKR